MKSIRTDPRSQANEGDERIRTAVCEPSADPAYEAHTVVITARRFKGETWQVHVRFPDGSYATHRGVVDFGYAGEIADRAVQKAEAMIAARGGAR